MRFEIAFVGSHVGALITGKLFVRLDPLVLAPDVGVEITLVRAHVVTLGWVKQLCTVVLKHR